MHSSVYEFFKHKVLDNQIKNVICRVIPWITFALMIPLQTRDL